MLTSFIEVSDESHFPIQNLPYGAYQMEDGDIHICSAIGDYIVDIFVLDEEGFFDGPELSNQLAFQDSSLNHFMSLGKAAWTEARRTLQKLLSKENPVLRDNDLLRQKVFRKQADVTMVLPVHIGDYTDFYSSEQHARNVGTMFRDPDNALLPNWKHLPVAYHGRSSSIVVSGTDLKRPKGQVVSHDAKEPTFGLSKAVDFELEVGFFTGPGNKMGAPISAEDAEQHIFGLTLVNDWSARDIQKWEYQPLGPFLAKNWATSVSPWIVTLEALEPFQRPMPEQTPKPLEYLRQPSRMTYDIRLEAYLKTQQQDEAQKISESNFKNLYWSMSQQLAHHTITGCNIKPGDLLASGTISGSDKDSYGSLLELTWNGEAPLSMSSGEERTYIEDGDEIILTGFAESEEYRVGFGVVTGKII